MMSPKKSLIWPLNPVPMRVFRCAAPRRSLNTSCMSPRKVRAGKACVEVPVVPVPVPVLVPVPEPVPVPMVASVSSAPVPAADEGVGVNAGIEEGFMVVLAPARISRPDASSSTSPSADASEDWRTSTTPSLVSPRLMKLPSSPMASWKRKDVSICITIVSLASQLRTRNRAMNSQSLC